MNTLKDFDLSPFTTKDEVLIENINIENCKISGIQSKSLRIINCKFKNVIFENSFFEIYACFEQCEFTECIFHDTFEGDDLELAVTDNIFTRCLFENISYMSMDVQSEIISCKFFDCSFINIKAFGDLTLVGLEVHDSKIRDFGFNCSEIRRNNFSDTQMENANIICRFISNNMQNVIFKNVRLRGGDAYSNDKIYKENTFVDCDQSGLKMEYVTFKNVIGNCATDIQFAPGRQDS